MNEPHIHHPGCGCHEPDEQGRRDFLKKIGTLAAGLGMAPAMAAAVSGDEQQAEQFQQSRTVQDGKAQVITLLQTADIHGQLMPHDEFFWENGQATYHTRGGFATLKTMVDRIRKRNPNTLLIDGGDCFQGSGYTSLSEGRVMIPLINAMNYDLALPGNWEVVYGKDVLMQDMGGYNAAKICANMFHDENDDQTGQLLFPPYWVKYIGGIKIGFIGYNDPLTPKRQSPAYSKGIRFTKPEENVARYVRYLRQYEGCKMIFLVTHMGLTQQVALAEMPQIEGVDYILGADTHERVRQPLPAKYAKVVEPGAFNSFLGRLDIVVENGQIKDQNYTLMEVDPERYKPDREMQRLVDEVREPYKAELSRVIGKTRSTLVRYFVMETNMDNFITDALMWKFKPDIALSNGFRFCPPLVTDPKTGEADITKEYLWSMLPVDSAVKQGTVTGKQLRAWFEKELENVFSKNPAKRFGGWLVRYQGMKVNFTIAKAFGERVNSILIGGKPIEDDKTYSVLACEREGDPDDTLCRIEKVQNPTKINATLHDVIEEYLSLHSPIEPRIEGRATATDATSDLLSQLEGYDYQFR